MTTLQEASTNPTRASGSGSERPSRPSVSEQRMKGYTGNFCTYCGSSEMVRTGVCETCLACGSTSGGCS